MVCIKLVKRSMKGIMKSLIGCVIYQMINEDEIMHESVVR